jgi:cardiolipin synthase
MLQRQLSVGSFVVGVAAALACGGCRDEATSTTTSTSTSTSMAASAGGATGSSSTSATGSTTDVGGAGGAPVVPACEVDVPRTVPLETWAEPTAGQTPFVDALGTAQSSIRVMVYQMGYGQILDTLKQKATSGVDVRVILDVSQQATNQKYFDQLTAAGATVQWSSTEFTYMHAKAIVVDDHVAILSTGNYLASQMAKERNYVVRDEDPADLQALVGLFEADWAHSPPDLSCTRLLVSPVNARERLLALIDSATSTIDVESMQFADTDVRAAIVARHDAGVTVRVLLADPAWIDANTAAAQYLADHGIAARYMSTPEVHVKAIAVDAALPSGRVYMGSENLSYTSLNKNREVGVIAFEASALSLASTTFDGDWATATPF